MKVILPDTCAFEFFSALAGIAVGAVLMLDIFTPVFPTRPKEFWCLIIVMLASLQLLSVFIERFNPCFLRGIISLVMGSFWIWFSLLQTTNDPTISIVITMITGLANYAAFTINFLISNKVRLK